jgi:hypothetical protein
MDLFFEWHVKKAEINFHKHGVSFEEARTVFYNPKEIMKKNSDKIDNEIKSEYDFDYTKAKPNRFANIVRERTILIPLEDDVAEVFNTPSEVNGVLRAIINAMPQRVSKKKKSHIYNSK